MAGKRKSRYRLLARIVAATLLVALSVAGWFGFWRFHLKRFEVVTPGVLYRSAQPTEYGVKHLIDWYDVKTVVCVRRDDEPLRAGLFDGGEPDGPLESQLVRELGAKYIHWPMGGEAYWPWFGPQEFEAFFELLDDPENLPVAVHCVGGRHRTGTFVALYRLEYQRWPLDKALAEMYSHDFGDPVPIQEHNLRTYFPRPRPSEEEWQALREFFAAVVQSDADYENLIRGLRRGDSGGKLQLVTTYIQERRPFALQVAQRIVDAPAHPLARATCELAEETLDRDNARHEEWAVAAAVLADFGDERQQARLLAILQNEPRTGVPTPKYQAAVVGVTNRYTENRAAFLRPLLGDLRFRPEPEAVYECDGRLAAYRYCDTAVARLATITNQNNIYAPSLWDAGRQFAVEWFAEHPEAQRPATLRKTRTYYLVREGLQDRDDYR